MGSMALDITGLTKRYRDFTLDNVAFSVPYGVVVGFIGENGAGKSTLLKIIVGELAPDEGSVTLAKGKTLGYLAQHQSLTSHNSIYHELLEVKKAQSKSLQQEMMKQYQSYREALERSYTNAKEGR